MLTVFKEAVREKNKRSTDVVIIIVFPVEKMMPDLAEQLNR